MKKETLLGMEVYYEDNPRQCEPRGHTGDTGPRGIPAPKPGVPEGVWVFGDSDEEDDFDNFDDVFEAGPILKVTFEPESHPVPIKGRIYFVKGINITAKLKEIRPLTKTAGILEMSHHDNIFYINPSDLRKASPEQVTYYLEESDYNNAP